MKIKEKLLTIILAILILTGCSHVEKNIKWKKVFDKYNRVALM